MSDVEILEELIAPGARVPLQQTGNRWDVELTEPACPASVVTIHGVPAGSVVMRADAFPAPDHVFTGLRGCCRRADFVLLAADEDGGVAAIVYIEMKASKASADEVVQQLRGARCVVEYAQSVGRTYWNQPAFLRGAAHRFVSLAHTALAKRRTVEEPHRKPHDRPERPLRISGAKREQYKKLLGR